VECRFLLFGNSVGNYVSVSVCETSARWRLLRNAGCLSVSQLRYRIATEIQIEWCCMGRGLSTLQSAILDTLANGQTLTTPEIRDRLLRHGQVAFHASDSGTSTFVLRRALNALYCRGLVACHSIPDRRGDVLTGARTFVWCRNDDAGLSAMGLSFGGLGEPNRRGRSPA
jgi:hypothetical protein